MSVYECDQFAADALAVRDEFYDKLEYDIHFNFPQIQEMVDTIDQSHGGIITDHHELTEAVMGRYEFLNEVEYSAYKRVLDRIYHRRLGAKSSINSRNGKFIPFLPTEAYEQ